MSKRTGRSHPTLSEVLARRAQEAEEERAREAERIRRMHVLRALQQSTTCTCPACSGRNRLPGVVTRPTDKP